MASGAGPHSAPTGDTGGSPSYSGGAAPSASAPVSTPAGESTAARRLNGLDIPGDNKPSSQPAASKKKRRGARAGGPDKNGRGLRQFSMRVCEKVESKGRTTYNEVADELVAEFSDPNINIESPDPDNPSAQQYDEKNIRRRVYDALNVLMAMETISKDKKEIQWRGLPKTSMNEIEELKTAVTGLKDRIKKKNEYLQDLEERYVCLQKLVRYNKQRYGSGDAPSSGLQLPFILLQTRRDANVQVEMSEDQQTMHVDFDSTPYELWDETFVLNAMGLGGKEETDFAQGPVANGGECSSTPSNHWHQSLQPPGPRGVGVPNSPPIPGILKGPGKHI